jgi:EmrB/QacA subfamily drug resistance transporter
VAIAVGPSLGGILIQAFGWRSVFWAVVPAGVVAFAIAWSVLPESADPEGRRLDLTGQMLAVVAVALLVLACIQGPTWGWASPAIVTSFAVGVTAVIGLLLWEAKSPAPLIPLGVFRHVSFSASLGVATLMTFGMYALLFLLPLYLQTVRHHSPLTAGLELLPMGLSFAIVSPFAGALADRVGPRTLIAGGMVLGGAGILILSRASAGTSIVELIVALTATGVALGLETGPLMAVAVASIPASRSGLASGLVNVARMVGATLGVAILGAVFASHAGHGTPSTAHFLTGLHRALLGGAGAEGAGGVIAWLWIDRNALRSTAPG